MALNVAFAPGSSECCEFCLPILDVVPGQAELIRSAEQTEFGKEPLVTFAAQHLCRGT